jgi:hypothetical protein
MSSTQTFKRYSARKLIGVKASEILRIFKGRFILVFDDGEIVTTARETAYSSLFWQFHQAVPDMPMLIKHHIRSCLGTFEPEGNTWKTQKFYNAKMHNEIGKAIYWSAHATKNKERVHRFDKDLNRLYFDTINKVYNFLAALEGYEISFNDKEYLGIRFHPYVDAAQKRLTRDPKVISEISKDVLNFVKTSPDLDNNALAKAVRAGMVRDMQFMQCILVRGYVEDIDNHIFEEPILRSFLDGLSQHDMLIESRAASKSLLYNKKVIQFVEYFSRTLQLQAMIVKNLHKGDCGSNSYTRWTVRPALMDHITGRTLRDGDLVNLEGKFYKINPEDRLKVIKKGDTHLIGQSLLLRSPVAGCRHPDPHGICSVCFGNLASSFDEHNLGVQCAAVVAAGQTQTVLSQKHAQSSSVADPIIIDDENRHIFTTNASKDSYILNEKLIGKKFHIILAKSECPGFFDLNHVDSVEEIGSITHATELTSVTFVVQSKDFEDRYDVLVSMGTRRSSLSLEMLDYVKHHPPVIKGESYEIDMSYWRSKAPFAILPLSQESPYVRASKIRSLVLGDSDNSKERDTADAPKALLQKLFDLLNSNLSINISLIEVLVYSLMVKNTQTNDYFLPKEDDRKGLGVNSHVMSKRSLSGMMAMEDHAMVILDTQSYEDRPRLDHTYDVIMKPQEHVMNYDPEALRSNY